MTSAARLALLRYVMIATGIIFTVGIFPLTRLWPSGWSWGAGHSHYLMMILGVYFTLGVSLLLAARDPLANRGLIWFTVSSSVVHAAIMAVEVVNDPAETGHLFGDVPALLIVAVALVAVTPRGAAVALGQSKVSRAA